MSRKQTTVTWSFTYVCEQVDVRTAVKWQVLALYGLFRHGKKCFFFLNQFPRSLGVMLYDSVPLTSTPVRVPSQRLIFSRGIKLIIMCNRGCDQISWNLPYPWGESRKTSTMRSSVGYASTHRLSSKGNKGWGRAAYFSSLRFFTDHRNRYIYIC